MTWIQKKEMNLSQITSSVTLFATIRKESSLRSFGDQGIYEIVEKSLQLFVEEYKKRNHLGGQE